MGVSWTPPNNPLPGLAPRVCPSSPRDPRLGPHTLEDQFSVFETIPQWDSIFVVQESRLQKPRLYQRLQRPRRLPIRKTIGISRVPNGQADKMCLVMTTDRPSGFVGQTQ